jgi:multidrug efflux system membrane fusion protein
MLRRFVTLLVVLAIVAGLAWWQRTAVVPFVATSVPGGAALIQKVPALAALAKKDDGGQAAEGQDGGKRRRGSGGPVTVVLAKAETKNLPVTIDAVGAANASASIAVRPRIDSQVVTVDVAEGARVEVGQRLFTLDDRTIKAQIAQLEAQVQKDKAQIEQARNDLNRANDLLQRNAGNAVTRDTAATALKVVEAQLAADQALLDSAKTTLTYTVITAPVSGRIGSVPTKPGSIVRTSDLLPLATVNQLDPSLVSFAIPQKRLGDLRTAMAKGPVKVEVHVGPHTLAGTVSFVENSIDMATGTITVKADVPNPDEILWPNAYVTVDVILDSGEPAVALPSNAVQIGQQGPYVFVVKDGRTAELRQVDVARSVGEMSVITKGVASGETVVVDGQLRLVDGAAVSVKGSGSEKVAAAADQPSSK